MATPPHEEGLEERPEKPQKLTKKQLAEMPGLNWQGVGLYDKERSTQARLCDNGDIIIQHGNPPWVLPANLDQYKKEGWKVERTYPIKGKKIDFTVRVRMDVVFVSFARLRARHRCENERLQRVLAILSQQRASEYTLTPEDGDGDQLANQLRTFLYSCTPEELWPAIKHGIKYRRKSRMIAISSDLRFKSDDFGRLAKAKRKKGYYDNI
jgi:hypothetical protein